MTQGDPKKVGLLTVVAVGAIGFLGYSLLGLGGGTFSPKAALPAVDNEASREQTSGFRLASDPFNHPELVRKKQEAQSASKTLAMGNAPQNVAAGSFPKPWAPPVPLPGSLNLDPDKPAEPPLKPAEIAGNTRPKIEENRIPVRLSAVVNVERAVAFLSVSGQESRSYSVGDRLAPGWRIVAIDDSGVLIVGKKDVVRLTVGQEATL